MADLRLHPDTHDICLENGDLRQNEGRELVRQRLKQTLLFFYGEWYLNTLAGRPYYEVVFIKAPVLASVEGVFKEAIISTSGVKELTAFNLDYDNTNRRLTLDFTVRTDSDEEINVGNFDILAGN